MISKLGVGILTIAALLVAVPSNVFAATSAANNKKIQKYYSDLKKLPNGKAPASKVSSLVKKLAQLDPKKANVYYKTGLTKLSPTATNKTAASKLATDVSKIVTKAGLPASTVKKVTNLVNKDNTKFQQKPTVTGTAMLLIGAMPVIA
jgi:hypothetical protein